MAPQIDGQLKSADIECLASAPANPSLGRIYYNTASNKLFIWNGSTWKEIAFV